jgi:hypothetical protein
MKGAAMRTTKVKPTIAQLKSGEGFRLILKVRQDRPLEFVYHELKRRTPPVWTFALLTGLNAGFVAWSVWQSGLPATVWVPQVLVAFLLAAILAPLLCLGLQRLALLGLGAPRVRLVVGKDQPVLNNVADDFVFDRGEYLTLLAYDLVPYLLWLSFAAAVEELRPAFATAALVQLLTNVGDFTLISLMWRFRSEEVYIFDDSFDGFTYYYSRVPDAIETVPAAMQAYPASG